jgi:hypothetical protein
MGRNFPFPRVGENFKKRRRLRVEMKPGQFWRIIQEMKPGI